MGKVLIVAIFVIGAIFTVILLSVQDKAKEAPELLSENEAEMQGKQLCREALQYGMKQINNGGVSITPNSSVVQTFSNFAIGDGIIDSIRYTSYTADPQTDTLKITSYATYQNGNETYHHKSSAIIAWLPQSFDAAITANGAINVGGNATVNGNIHPFCNPQLDFEEFFGMTKAEMRAIADHDLVNAHPNPGHVNGITYASFTGAYPGTFKVTQTHWHGSGILVVDGDMQVSGGSFNGIMWIVGRFRINGNNGYHGAIYVEGIAADGSILATPVTGTCDISYDLGQITTAASLVGGGISSVTSYGLEILNMYEDD